MEAPILEGPRAQNPYHQASDLLRSGVQPVRDDAACRSDPTFTRASPGLAVAEQLPQIITVIIVIFDFLKKLPGYFTLGRRLAPPAHGISLARLVFRVLPGAPRLTPPSQRGPGRCPPQWEEVGAPT